MGWVIDGRQCRLRSRPGESTSPARINQHMIPADPSITHPAQTEGRQLAPHLPTVALTRWTAPPGQRRPLAAPVDKSGTSCNRQARPPMPHRSPDAWGWIHPSPTATGSATRWPWSMRGRPCGFVAAGRRPPMRPASQSAIPHRRRWCAMVLHDVKFQRGFLRSRRRAKSHRDPARAGPGSTGRRPHVRHHHPGSRPIHEGRTDPQARQPSQRRQAIQQQLRPPVGRSPAILVKLRLIYPSAARRRCYSPLEPSR